MSTPTPSVAVVNLASVRDALGRAGYTMLADSVDPRDVAAAARQAQGEVVVIAADVDQTTSMWLDFQVVKSHRKVLVLYSDQRPAPDKLPNQVRTLPLPATVNEIMAIFGAPALDTAEGRQLIGEDGEPVSVPELDPADPFLSHEPWPATPSTPEPVWQPSSPVHVPEVPVFPGPPQDHQMPTPVAVHRMSPVSPLPQAFTAVPGPPAPRRAVDPSPVPAPQPVPEPRVYFPQGPPPAQPAPQMFPIDVQAPFAPSSAPVSSMGPSRQCPVVFVVSAKGGVGKTTISTSLAQHAAENGMQRSALVDMNRGQGDVRKYLRVSDTNGLVPTVYDAALAPSPSGVGVGNPQGALIRPMIVNQHRPGLAPVAFGCVFAPRDGQADPSIVTTDFYAEVIRSARTTADLVVVDTQIVESYDLSELFTRIVVPLLASDPQAWCVSVTGPAMPGVHSMIQRWATWAQHGVSRDRTMFFFNRWVDGSTMNQDAIAAAVGQYATFLGAVADDPTIFAAMSQGKIPNNVPALGEILDQVLLRVTGSPVFATDRYTKSRPGLLSRLVGGRR